MKNEPEGCWNIDNGRVSTRSVILRRKLLPVLWWQHLFQSGEIFALRKVYFKVNICLFIPFLFMFHHSEAPILLLGLHFYSFYIDKTGNKKILFYVENVLWQQLRLKWFICSTLHNICEKFTEKVKCNIVLQMIHDLQFFNRKAVFHIHVFNIKSTFSLGYVMFILSDTKYMNIAFIINWIICTIQW